MLQLNILRVMGMMVIFAPFSALARYLKVPEDIPEPQCPSKLC